MTRKSKSWILIGVWVAVTTALLLAPTPRGLGDWGRRFSISYDEIKLVLQPTAHFLMMATGAFLLMQLFVKRHRLVALLLSVGLALLLAFSLELCQHVLPAKFARACDMNDLIPSLGGALLGALTALCFRPRRTKTIVPC